MRYGRLKRIEAIIQQEQRMAAERYHSRFFLDRQGG
jgi:hypothetical protein